MAEYENGGIFGFYKKTIFEIYGALGKECLGYILCLFGGYPLSKCK